MKDLVIGVFSNHGLPEIKPWVNSLAKTDFAGEKVVVVSNVTQDVIDYLKSHDYKIYHQQVMYFPVVERFFAIPEVLKDFIDIRYVITTDVRDVIFQKNPSEWLENNLKAPILASGEGLLYRDEPWSHRNMVNSFGEEEYENMKDRQIRCAGVIAGEYGELVPFLRNIWLLCQNKPSIIQGGGGPDQAAYNILLRDLEKSNPNLIHYVSNNDDWACQAGTTIPAIKAGSGDIGYLYQAKFFPGLFEDELKKIMLDEPPVFDHGIVKNSKYQDYYIVHQYNRIPDWNKELIERYVPNV